MAACLLCVVVWMCWCATASALTFEYATWSTPLKARLCSRDSTPREIVLPSREGGVGILPCATVSGRVVYQFPAGVFEIDQQLLVPPDTAITGASNPNDEARPTQSPQWDRVTLFLATRGVSDYRTVYCHAKDMVTTRVGFVLSSRVSVRNVAYQGVDTIRPDDNGALCGGGAFETKGCAENDCRASAINNGGSDGVGSVGVVLENIRLNDYFYAQDRDKIGAAIAGNSDCGTAAGCCFCQPNGVRTSQVGVWVPQTRNTEGTRDLVVRNLVSRSTQAGACHVSETVWYCACLVSLGCCVRERWW
jgi:hypothetical protein